MDTVLVTFEIYAALNHDPVRYMRLPPYWSDALYSPGYVIELVQDTLLTPYYMCSFVVGEKVTLIWEATEAFSDSLDWQE